LMVFYLVAVGRVRHAGLRAACEDYLERTRRYAKLEIREVPDGSRGTKPKNLVLREEADALRKAVPDAARAIALTRSGRLLDSRSLAGAIDRWRVGGRHVAFVIGGAYGLDPSLHEWCDEAIRLSEMTLPHELARLVLLEQLYRGHTILRGEPYHKGD
jgi:23S rRNA (pseudouridine1915-N3)-methyltransferase